MSKLRIVDRIRRCEHQRTVCVISDGLERVICEDCGDVTVRYEAMISGDVSRSQFARKTDELHREQESEIHETSRNDFKTGSSQGRFARVG